MADQSYPRCLYRGPADDTVETCAVPDGAAETVALADGWRTKRVPPAGVVAEVVHAVTRAVTGHPAKKGGKS